MSFITDLKDRLIRKLATSFLLSKVDGYKTDIARAVQGANMVIAGLYVAAPSIDAHLGTHLMAQLDFVNAKYLLGLQLLGHLGIEVGLQDKAAKDRADSKRR